MLSGNTTTGPCRGERVAKFNRLSEINNLKELFFTQPN